MPIATGHEREELEAGLEVIYLVTSTLYLWDVIVIDV